MLLHEDLHKRLNLSLKPACRSSIDRPGTSWGRHISVPHSVGNLFSHILWKNPPSSRPEEVGHCACRSWATAWWGAKEQVHGFDLLADMFWTAVELLPVHFLVQHLSTKATVFDASTKLVNRRENRFSLFCQEIAQPMPSHLPYETWYGRNPQ